MGAVKKLMATDPLDPATARWVIEMQEGRPKQQVVISGQLTITDRLRGLPEVDLAALLSLLRKVPDSAARPGVESEVPAQKKALPDSSSST